MAESSYNMSTPMESRERCARVGREGRASASQSGYTTDFSLESLGKLTDFSSAGGERTVPSRAEFCHNN